MHAVPTTFDDLDDLGPIGSTVGTPAPVAQAKPAAVLIDCPKCRGTGRFTSWSGRECGSCFTCKGSGKVRPDWQKRKAAWKKGQETMARNQANKRAEFEAANPDVCEWLKRNINRGFRFADSLNDGLNQYGSLTEKQTQAVRNCMQKEAVRREQNQQARPQEDVRVGGQAVMDALMRAQAAKGLEAASQGKRIGRVWLRTEAATFKMASDKSVNKGSIYVISPDNVYLGKIAPNGVYWPSRECTPAQRAEVVTVLTNPLEAAVRYGRAFGKCSCCGRRLDNEESIKLGIGPICRSRMFG